VLALLAAAVYVTVRPPRRRPAAPPTPARLRVGIIAGHWQFDSGAICDDGLREVDITTVVARRVVEQLRQKGYDAEMLAEYDDRLQGYLASALVSVHVDSCTFDLSGYKCVGSSHLPAAADSALLAQSIISAYPATTGLAFHANTITPDMTDYHAFQSIDPRTPAAIIELGFMSGDRDLLVAHPDRAAQGVANGILAFLAAKAHPQATAAPQG